jgi:hypothetical protein
MRRPSVREGEIQEFMTTMRLLKCFKSLLNSLEVMLSRNLLPSVTMRRPKNTHSSIYIFISLASMVTYHRSQYNPNPLNPISLNSAEQQICCGMFVRLWKVLKACRMSSVLELKDLSPLSYFSSSIESFIKLRDRCCEMLERRLDAPS